MFYASFRRHSSIYSWDLRGSIESPAVEYHYEPGFVGRSSSEGVDFEVETTNQRRRFDLDVGGRYLSVGDQVSRPSFSLPIES
jgi:telomerase Cajal body protein 1